MKMRRNLAAGLATTLMLALNAGCPGPVGTPYWSNNSLDWYSCRFIPYSRQWPLAARQWLTRHPPASEQGRHAGGACWSGCVS